MRQLAAHFCWVGLGFVAWPPAAGFAETFNGSAEVGVREVSVDGSDAKYRQHVDLEDGVRLFGASFMFRPDSSNSQAPDLIDFRAHGLGGDPFQDLTLNIRNDNRYGFRYRRQKSDYYYADLLTGTDQTLSEDLHHFDFERVREQIGLDLHLTRRALVRFDYQRYDKTGDSTTVYDIEREEFDLDKPLDEVLETYSVSLEYRWDDATLIWTERLKEFATDASVFAPGASVGSEPGEPTELDFFFLDQPYTSDTLEHQLRLIASPAQHLELRFDVLLTTLDLDLDVHERTQGIDFSGMPFVRDLSGDGGAERDTDLFEIAGAYRISDSFRLLASARRNTLDQDADLAFDGASDATRWDMEADVYGLGIEWLVTDSVVMSAGWSSEQRTTKFVQAGSAPEKHETDRHGYNLSVAYNPIRALSLTVTAEHNDIDDPFTLASPTDSRRYRIRGRYQFDNRIAMSISQQRTERENHTSGWKSDVTVTSLRLGQSTDRWNWSIGAALADMERSIDQFVVGGFRQDLFAIDYDAETSQWDASAGYTLSDRWAVGGYWRSYENDGGFSAERDDARAFVDLHFGDPYRVRLSYRNIDFEEDRFEAFDADIWELSLHFDWQ